MNSCGSPVASARGSNVIRGSGDISQNCGFAAWMVSGFSGLSVHSELGPEQSDEARAFVHRDRLEQTQVPAGMRFQFMALWFLTKEGPSGQETGGGVARGCLGKCQWGKR